MRKGDDLTTFLVPKVKKIRSLNLPEPPGPPRPVAAHLYLYGTDDWITGLRFAAGIMILCSPTVSNRLWGAVYYRPMSRSPFRELQLPEHKTHHISSTAQLLNACSFASISSLLTTWRLKAERTSSRIHLLSLYALKTKFDESVDAKWERTSSPLGLLYPLRSDKAWKLCLLRQSPFETPRGLQRARQETPKTEIVAPWKVRSVKSCFVYMHCHYNDNHHHVFSAGAETKSKKLKVT